MLRASYYRQVNTIVPDSEANIVYGGTGHLPGPVGVGCKRVFS